VRATGGDCCDVMVGGVLQFKEQLSVVMFGVGFSWYNHRVACWHTPASAT